MKTHLFFFLFPRTFLQSVPFDLLLFIMKTVKLLQTGLWSSGFFKDNVCSLVCYTRNFSRDIRAQKRGRGGCRVCGVFFSFFFFPLPCYSLLCWVFFKYQSRPNLWREAPDALLLLWVKKEQLTDGVSWMKVSIASWLLATLLNVGHFGFVTFQLVRNKFLLQLPHKMCLLLWQFMFLLSSLLKPLDKCNDWKGCIFYLMLLYPSSCCELIILQHWVWFCFVFSFVWIPFCNLVHLQCE